MSKNTDIKEYAFSNVTFTSSKKEDFENILKSLHLKESLNLESLSMKNIVNLLEKDLHYKSDLKFFDINKGALLKEEENPYLKLFNNLDNNLNLLIDEESFSINMHLQDTFMHGSKFGDLNKYIQNTLKNIATENNSELFFIHSEKRFAHSIGKVFSFDETSLFDKSGKDITPDVFKVLNSYTIDDKQILKDKPSYEDLVKMIDESEKNGLNHKNNITKDSNEIKLDEKIANKEIIDDKKDSNLIVNFAKSITETIKKPFILKKKTTSKNKNMER